MLFKISENSFLLLFYYFSIFICFFIISISCSIRCVLISRYFYWIFVSSRRDYFHLVDDRELSTTVLSVHNLALPFLGWRVLNFYIYYWTHRVFTISIFHSDQVLLKDIRDWEFEEQMSGANRRKRGRCIVIVCHLFSV